MRFVGKEDESARREQILREERERNESAAADEAAKVERQRNSKKDK